MKIFNLIFFLSFNLFSAPQFDLESTFSQRAFQDDDNPITNTFNSAIGMKFGVKAKSDEDNFRVKIIIDSLYDFSDKDRFYIYPEEAWVGYDDGSNIIKVGFQHFNWSSTEAFRPSDVVNSRNLDSQVKNASKIGEPMISYKRILGESSITGFISPYFIKPLYPGVENSFATPPIPIESYLVNTEGLKTDKEPFNIQGGAIFNFSLSKSDIAIHYINHIDRDAFIPLINPLVPNITPIFYRNQQVGITSQSAVLGLILKTEFVARFFSEDVVTLSHNSIQDFQIATIGIERNFSLGKGEFTFLTEYIRTFSQNISQQNAEVFDNDLLIGFRHSFNNINGSELNLSLISDMKDLKQHILNFSYAQRIKNNWKVELGLNYVESEVLDSYIGVDILDSADYVYLDIKRFF